MYNLGLRSEKSTKKPFPHLEEDNTRQGFFERAEFESVFARLPAHLRSVVTFAYYTGWRVQSEILPLTWDRVDLEAGTVRLYKGTTKNKDGRVIILPQILRDIVEAQWQEHLTLYPECPFVFHREGQQIKYFRRRWARACEEIGLTGKIPHDFRRTAVWNLVRAGVPERVAMMITGHKTRSIFDRYNIVSEGDLAEAARKIDLGIASRQSDSSREQLPTTAKQEEKSKQIVASVGISRDNEMGRGGIEPSTRGFSVLCSTD